MADGKRIDLSKAQCSLSVGGLSLDVLSLEINLALGAPPQFTCMAVPSWAVAKQVVNSATDPQFWAATASADRVYGQPEVSLQFSMSGDTSFSFNASGWVLSDMTLSASAVAERPEAVIITAQHPIVLLSKYPVNAGPVKESPNPGEMKGPTDYIEIVKKAIKVYSDHVSDSTKQQPVYKFVQQGADRLSEFITCTGCDVSGLTKLFTGIKDPDALKLGFNNYILSSILNGSAGSSLFSLVALSLASELSFGLYVDPSDISSNKMILRPNVPYTPDCVNINPDTVLNVTGSLGDWLSPSGLYISLSTLRTPVHNAPETSGQSGQDTLFASVAARDGGIQIVPTAIPAWINALFESAFQDYFHAPSTIKESPESLNLEDPKHVKVVQSILSQYLLDMYRQAKSITITRLFSESGDSGGLLVPGRSCRLSPPGLGDGLVFLITTVAHSFSLLNNTASTSIVGNYLRGSTFSMEVDGATPAKLISGGFSENKNYIWG